MKTKKYVDFDNEVQEEIKQCLMEDRLATTKTSSLKQAKEFVYNLNSATLYLTLFISACATKSYPEFCHVRIFTYLSVAKRRQAKL